MKILLTVYSFKNIQNDLHQIYLYIEIQLTSVGFAHTLPNKEPNNKSRNAVHCWVSVSEVNGVCIVHECCTHYLVKATLSPDKLLQSDH